MTEHIMKFVTVWEGGAEVRTGCDWKGYHPSGLMRIENIETVDDPGYDSLERTYIESPQGEEIRSFYDADNDVLYEDGQAQETQ